MTGDGVATEIVIIIKIDNSMTRDNVRTETMPLDCVRTETMPLDGVRTLTVPLGGVRTETMTRVD